MYKERNTFLCRLHSHTHFTLTWINGVVRRTPTHESVSLLALFYTNRNINILNVPHTYLYIVYYVVRKINDN